MWPFGRFSGAASKAEAAKTAGVLFPLTPSLSPKEREKHSSVLSQYFRAWLSSGSETMYKKTETATATSESPNAVATLSLSLGRGMG